MEKELIILVGPIGSGKTTFSKTLETQNSIRISQDETGKREHLNEFYDALTQNIPRIIIDRMNFNVEQRMRYITPARSEGYVITIIELQSDWDTCVDRVYKRENHPTVENGNLELANRILKFYNKNYEQPTKDEYDNYSIISV